ncbi:MAG: hypothetical protein KDE53_21990, partial [Caldilineaceae bacterium]|nr:hypothetical protein [Caldilineaceae bacterium]
EDWWGGPLGDKTETIEAVRAIPAFIRTFSWGESGTDDDGEPVDEEDNGEDSTGTSSLEWDSRLDGLGVRLTRMTAAQGWRLVSALYRDVHESDNKHHIYITAIDGNQRPVAGAKFLVDWIGRRTDEQPGLLTTDDRGMANYAMFINMHPEEKDGILFALAQNQPSDRVDGMGLPNNHHVCFDLTFQVSPA